MARFNLTVNAVIAGVLLIACAGCDTSYTGAHRVSDASTGSMLQGTDTGVSANGLGDAGIQTMNGAGAPSGH